MLFSGSILSLFFIGFVCVSYVTGQDAGYLLVEDLLEHNTVSHTWMEIGYVNLTDTEWTTVTTTVTDLNPDNDREISVFLSLPEYGGSTADEGWPMVTKMNGRATRTASGAYTFEARLVQPNDSYCPHIWWTPENSDTINVGWMVVEEGVYNVTSSMLVFGSGEMTRDNTVPLLGDDTPALYHAKFVMNYTTGCYEDDPEAVCTFTEKVSDFEFVTTPFNDVEWKYSDTGWSHLGATNQIQTSVNKAPDVNGGEKEMWMNTRVRTVFTDRISMMLAVHSVFVNTDQKIHGPYGYNFTIYPDYADIHTPEIVSYFVWEKNLRLECIEGLVMETAIHFPITDSFLRVDYHYEYTTLPGLFGLIGTLNSVADTTSLRVFDRTISGSSFITQEDQCTDEEQKHRTPEAAFTMVVGASKNVQGDTQCFIVFDIQPCTYTIHLYDLFMDGWENSVLVVDTGDEVLNFTTSCGSKSVSFTSRACRFNAHMQTSDGNAPVTWWENYWRYDHLDYRTRNLNGDVYIGDYDTTISVIRNDVVITDAADYRVDAKENKCEQCKVAPPPPGKGKGKGAEGDGKGMGDGEGDGNGDGNGSNGGVAQLTAGNIAPAPPVGVGVAPAAGAPAGVLQITGVSGRNAGSDPATFTVYYALNVVDLTSAVDSAGFYRGAEGENGPSIHLIDVTGHTTSFYVEGSFVISEEDVHNWISGKIYVQVNTANWLSGEIRAQAVLPSDWLEYYLSTLDDDVVKDLVGDGSKEGDDDRGTGSKGNDDDGSGAKANDDDGNRKMSKPKPVPVLIELFEDSATGWYNDSGTWSYPMSALNDNRRRLHPKPVIELPPKPTYALDTSVAMFPDILMYPTYVIMTADKTKQLHVGSLCPHRGVERCEERLPPVGEFVFRVMGKDPEGDDSWKFCGVEGFVGQELQFEMKKGVCVPTTLVNAHTFCSVNTVVTVGGVVVIGGVTTELNEVDSSVLENEIANMLVSTLSVSITSWAANEEGNMEVSFEATVLAEKHGVDGRYRANIDTFVSNLQNNMETAFSSGAFMSHMQTVLAEFSQGSQGLSTTTFASLKSMEIKNIAYVEPSTAGGERTPATLPKSEANSPSEAVAVREEDAPSVIFMSCIVVGVVVVVAALAVRSRQPTDQFSHQELAVDSEHAVDTIPEFDLGLESVGNKKGIFFVSNERF